MYLKRFDSLGIAHFSYLLGSQDEAIIIDPRRDIEEYLEVCTAQGFNINYIFETHRNEDYAIGSLELKQKIKSIRIFHGGDLPFTYGEPLKDGQEFSFGDCRVKAIHTPGHTLGSFSFVVFGEDMENQPQFVFTGDALFAGETGRTDFYGADHQREMSGKLYDSLHTKILPLGDEVILYPGHGAGSVCGSGIKEREPSTIGIEKKLCPFLSMTKEEFIQKKINEKHTTAPYFTIMEDFNLGYAPLLSARPFPIAIDPESFKSCSPDCVQIIDARTPSGYGGAHIKNSLFIWLGGLPSFAGWFLDYNKPAFLILEKQEDLEMARTYLSRIGYDKVIGYIPNGILNWAVNALPLSQTKILTVHTLKQKIDENDEITLLDVRSEEEFDEGHLPNSENIYVGHIPTRIHEISKDKPIVVYCTVGLRATLAASYLEQQGFEHIEIVLGSFSAWEHAGYEIIH